MAFLTVLRAALQAGPVGVYYACKLAWEQRRMARLALYLERERELHRAMQASLRLELDAALQAHLATQVAAAGFWRQVRGTGNSGLGSRQVGS